MPLAEIESEGHWFKFETKIRKIIKDLIDPINHQLNKDKADREALFSAISKVEDKFTNLSEMQMAIHKNKENMSYLRQEMRELKDHNRMKDTTNSQEFTKLNFFCTENREKIKLIQAEIGHYNTVMNHSKEEIKKIHKFCVNFRDTVSAKCDNLENDILSVNSNVKYQISTLESKVEMNQQTESGNKKVLNDFGINLEIAKARLEEVNLSLEDLCSTKVDYSDYESLKIRIERDYRILQRYTIDLNEDIRRTSNYIDKQIPLELIHKFGEILDYLTPSNGAKLKLQQIIQQNLNILKVKFMNDKGRPDNDLQLSEVLDSNFLWAPLFNSEKDQESETEESESSSSSNSGLVEKTKENHAQQNIAEDSKQELKDKLKIEKDEPILDKQENINNKEIQKLSIEDTKKEPPSGLKIEKDSPTGSKNVDVQTLRSKIQAFPTGDPILPLPRNSDEKSKNRNQENLSEIKILSQNLIQEDQVKTENLQGIDCQSPTKLENPNPEEKVITPEKQPELDNSSLVEKIAPQNQKDLEEENETQAVDPAKNQRNELFQNDKIKKGFKKLKNASLAIGKLKNFKRRAGISKPQGNITTTQEGRITPEMLNSMVGKIPAEKIDIISLLRCLPPIPSQQEISLNLMQFWTKNSSKLTSKISSEYKTQLNSKIKKLSLSLNSRIETMEQNLLLKIQEFSRKLENSLETLQFEQEQINDNNLRIESEISLTSIKLKSEISCAMRNLTLQIDNCKRGTERNNEIYDKFNHAIKVFLQVLKIKSCLDEQDELDRNSLALWGAHQKQSAKARNKDLDEKSLSEEVLDPSQVKTSLKNDPYGAYNLVKLERECVSCTNQSPIILSAFKMACLAYIPSKVRYNQKEYERKELF
ncbi:unnamed protein product [Moneuplotes crassus]|uniref:Uncharacterized protein n=1 Tax=Euplotes crassus TaxID=5936 RepID=A0AAD2D4E5_EUPCR|nr:unnamed protein product [Moneuplotes crassus]